MAPGRLFGSAGHLPTEGSGRWKYIGDHHDEVAVAQERMSSASHERKLSLKAYAKAALVTGVTRTHARCHRTSPVPML
eukprot:6565071-Prymnesium_polylepis.1